MNSNSHDALARRVIDQASDAFISIDANSVIRGWNPSAERIFGWAADEAIGRPIDETIIPPALRSAHRAGMDRSSAREGPRRWASVSSCRPCAAAVRSSRSR